MIGSTCLGTEDEPRLKSVLQPSSWCLFRVLLESLFRRASILLSQPSILLVWQLILSSQFIFCQACMAGILFAKFTTPTSRAETIIFSKNALITLRNGSLYLVIRVADLRCRFINQMMLQAALLDQLDWLGAPWVDSSYPAILLMRERSENQDESSNFIFGWIF